MGLSVTNVKDSFPEAEIVRAATQGSVLSYECDNDDSGVVPL